MAKNNKNNKVSTNKQKSIVIPKNFLEQYLIKLDDASKRGRKNQFQEIKPERADAVNLTLRVSHNLPENVNVDSNVAQLRIKDKWKNSFSNPANAYLDYKANESYYNKRAKDYVAKKNREEKFRENGIIADLITSDPNYITKSAAPMDNTIIYFDKPLEINDGKTIIIEPTSTEIPTLQQQLASLTLKPLPETLTEKVLAYAPTAIAAAPIMYTVGAGGAVPLVTSMWNNPISWGLSTVGGMFGSEGVNSGIRLLSNYKYNSWGDMLGNTNDSKFLFEFTNPGGGIFGIKGWNLGLKADLAINALVPYRTLYSTANKAYGTYNSTNNKIISNGYVVENGNTSNLTTKLLPAGNQTQKVNPPIQLSETTLTILPKNTSTVQPKVNTKPVWEREHLSGYQLKILMEGSPLENAISKNGTINVNVLRSLLKSTSKLNKDIIENVINTKFAGQKNIDYNALRRAVQEELITFDQTSEGIIKFRGYGLDGLGYSVPPNFNKFSGTSPDVESKVTLFTSEKIPNGSAKHFSENTLAHTRSFTHPDEPDVLYVMESLSDWALHSKNSTASSIDREIKLLNKIAEQGDDGFITSEAINNRIEALLKDKANLPIQTYTPHEKYLIDNHVRRLLYENLKIAASNGRTKMRYPTPETAAKILYYPKKYDILPGQDGAMNALQLLKTKKELLRSVRPRKPRNILHESKKFFVTEGFDWTNLELSKDGKNIIVTDAPGPYNLSVDYIMWDPEIKKLVEKLPDLEVPASLIAQMEHYNKHYPLWKNQRDEIKAALSEAENNLKRATNESEMLYSPKYQTILKKYADFPKMYKSIFKNGEVRTVTDAKGNTWYEVDVPENFLDMELLYKKGGIIKRFTS